MTPRSTSGRYVSMNTYGGFPMGAFGGGFGGFGGYYAVGDQNAQFADNSNSQTNEVPAWAVGLIVLGSIVLVALVAVIVQVFILVRRGGLVKA